MMRTAKAPTEAQSGQAWFQDTARAINRDQVKVEPHYLSAS